METTNSDIALVTVSYDKDFDICRNMCESVDRLMPDVRHYVIVSKRDKAMFQCLETPSRVLIMQEDVLPNFWYFTYKGRRFWQTPYRLKPVDGWHVQQFAKLAFVATLPHQAVIMVDSDVEFIRPLTKEMLLSDGRTRCLRYPLKDVKHFVRIWSDVAAGVLDVPVQGDPTHNYVDSCVVWRPEIVKDLLERIAAQAGTSWQKAVCRQRTFSEYFLYGLFVEKVPGADAGRTYFETERLCLSLLYALDPLNPNAEDEFVSELSDHHIAFGIQENIGMSPQEHESLSERIRKAVV